MPTTSDDVTRAARTPSVGDLVVSLWRYLVKSLRGEQLSAAEIAADGIRGDRVVRGRNDRGLITARMHPKLLVDVLRDIHRRFGGTLALNAAVLSPGWSRVGDRAEILMPRTVPRAAERRT